MKILLPDASLNHQFINPNPEKNKNKIIYFEFQVGSSEKLATDQVEASKPYWDTQGDFSTTHPLPVVKVILLGYPGGLLHHPPPPCSQGNNCKPPPPKPSILSRHILVLSRITSFSLGFYFFLLSLQMSQLYICTVNVIQQISSALLYLVI